MSYGVTLRKFQDVEDQDFFLFEAPAMIEDEKQSYLAMSSLGDTLVKNLTEVEKTLTHPTASAEGLIGSLYDFVSTMIGTAMDFVGNTAKWLGKKIRAIVNIRKRQKEYRDKKMESLMRVHGGLSPAEKNKADEKFKQYKLDYCPSVKGYRVLCEAFASLFNGINENIKLYTTKDVTLFSMEDHDISRRPSWVAGIYDSPKHREDLQNLGISYEENQFTCENVFKSIPSSTIGELNFNGIEDVRVINTLYLGNCWKNLKAILELKERFEAFEEILKGKKRALKRDIAKTDKQALVKACKSVVASSMLAGRLSAYLCQIEEALDVRRGWLIDKALQACGSELSS